MRTYRQSRTGYIFLVTAMCCWRLFRRQNIRGVDGVRLYDPAMFTVERGFTPVALITVWQEFRSELEYLHREGAI